MVTSDIVPAKGSLTITVDCLNATFLPKGDIFIAPGAQTESKSLRGEQIRGCESMVRMALSLARRHGVEVPDAVKLFFDAVESGNWDEIEARFKMINGGGNHRKRRRT